MVYFFYIKQFCLYHYCDRVINYLAAMSRFHQISLDLSLTMYATSQYDLKSNQVIRLKERHYFEYPAETRLCVTSCHNIFLLCKPFP